MSDEGVEFGVLRETTPEPRRRPDLDAHYSTVACGSIAGDDLPIFVELDVWREMIDHACSDTNVELGGVLLGGTFYDEAQRPFVLVTDSLRAEHYEATRGSFKFTHETWEAITRRRAEFSGELHMVGWYHTHPDWGVFLSSMDLFICDHFFAKPLDVALVIDPCRADWGFFQWTGRAGQPPRRTAGFYLVAARTRSAELEQVAEVFRPAGGVDMPADPRWSTASQSAPSGSPVVHIHHPPAPSQPAALWVAVVLQTLLLAVLAWRTLVAPASSASSASSDDSLRRFVEAQRADARSNAQTELMNRVLADLAAAPEGSFHQLAELQEHNDELKSAVRAHVARERELVDLQNKQAAQARRDRQSLEGKLETVQQQQDRLRRELDDKSAKLTEVTQRLKALEPDAGDEADQAAARLPWYRSSVHLSAGIVAIVAALAAGWWLQQQRRPAPANLEE